MISKKKNQREEYELSERVRSGTRGMKKNEGNEKEAKEEGEEEKNPLRSSL